MHSAAIRFVSQNATTMSADAPSRAKVKQTAATRTMISRSSARCRTSSSSTAASESRVCSSPSSAPPSASTAPRKPREDRPRGTPLTTSASSATAYQQADEEPDGDRYADRLPWLVVDVIVGGARGGLRLVD